MSVLLATDGSADARAAADFLGRLQLPAGSPVTLLSVVDSVRELLRHLRPRHVDGGALLTSAESILDAEAARIAHYGWQLRCETRTGHPADCIIRAATEVRADLIVMGCRGRAALGAFRLGSVSHKVVRYAGFSVLVVRQPAGSEVAAHVPSELASGRRPLRVLAACDTSDASLAAVSGLARLGLGEGASVALVSVITPSRVVAGDPELTSLWNQEKSEAERGLAAAAAVLADSGAQLTSEILEGDASVALLERASVDTDLIVIGPTGRSRVERFLLGGVSSRVVDYAECSVWVGRS